MADKSGKKYLYKCTIKWKEKKTGLLSFGQGKQDIETATPPEFNGHPGYVSPEELLLSAVNSCFMTTFLYYAFRENLEFTGYECIAEGDLEMKDMKMQITKIRLHPKIKVKTTGVAETVNKLLEKSLKNCYISNSVKAEITLKPEII